jgi:hypothetical protein
MKEDLTQAQLKELLWYDPDTGVFRWRKERRGGAIAPWSVAGWMESHGYVRIKVAERSYYAHRLAWLYMTGEHPAHEVDHKNGQRNDNVWANLRQADTKQNRWNSAIRSDNTSGVKGVSCRGSVWTAECRVSGERHYIGCFKTKEEATAQVQKFREAHHGEFARH